MYKLGKSIYLKKTGEKFTIIGTNTKTGYTIEDMKGTAFYGVKANEFKKEPKQEQKFKFYSDSGHSWVAVPYKLLQDLGIEKSVTSYSYISPSGKTAYLEEDNDASLFSKAYKEKYGKDFAYEERIKPSGNSPIRSYPPYKVYSAEEKKETEELRNNILNNPSRNWSPKAIRRIKRASKKPYILYRFGFYSVKKPNGDILFNATNISDANAVFKKFAKRPVKKSDIRYG